MAGRRNRDVALLEESSLIRSVTWRSTALLLSLSCLAPSVLAQDRPPTEWIEPQTHHRVVRLSREPGSESLYFHQYAFSADGHKLVMTTPSGLSTVDLRTRKVELVVPGFVRPMTTGRKTGDIYYLRRGAVYAANLLAHKTRHVADLPPDQRTGNVAVNADETMLVGLAVDPSGESKPRTPPEGEGSGRLGPRWAAGRPMVMYTIDIATGHTNIIHHSNDWLNHLQCSPTDPHQIMFCHEGPWHLVDRTWLVRTDGTDLTQVHKRFMDMEIAGHEFFSADGRSVWYDLQTPRSLVFWLAGYDVQTHEHTWYHLERSEWSVHYNISPDGKLFAGDGGGPGSVANQSPNHQRLDPPGNGQWIYLFRPEPTRMTGLPQQAAHLVKTGVLHAERLVDMSHHDYSLEPNVMFTPDGKWIVFRSNMFGPSHVFEVEVARASESP
jgi:oligogalacturonide lyase